MSNIIKENCNHSLVFIFTWADEVRNLLARADEVRNLLAKPPRGICWRSPAQGEAPPPFTTSLPPQECASRKVERHIKKGEEGGAKKKNRLAPKWPPSASQKQSLRHENNVCEFWGNQNSINPGIKTHPTFGWSSVLFLRVYSQTYIQSINKKIKAR